MIRSPRMILLFFLLLGSIDSFTSPPGWPWKDSLQFTNRDVPYNVVELEMSANTYRNVRLTQGQKLHLSKTNLKFNGQPVAIDEIHLHGKTTLYYERKSFSVDASEKIKICAKGCKPLKAFYLLSLAMDKNYFHNRLCFDLLKELNLFHLQYEYAEVRINGQSQGIYLMLQRPQDWSMKTIQSPFILRRGLAHEIDKEKFEKDLDKKTVKDYRQQFSSIYKLIHQYSGNELYEKLSEVLHVEDYLRWLAFNFIIKNGDYSDELYFYIEPETKRFRIIPWDFDDVFRAEPHEGKEAWNRKMDPSSLIFSSEDDLDVKISRDPFLYAKYLRCLSDVTEELSGDKLESVMSKLYDDLSPFFSSEEILEAASKDGYTTSLQILKADLSTVHQYLGNQKAALNKIDGRKP